MSYDADPELLAIIKRLNRRHRHRIVAFAVGAAALVILFFEKL